MKDTVRSLAPISILLLLSACTLQVGRTPTPPASATAAATASPLPEMSILSISPGEEENGRLITLSSGGDVDTQVVAGGRRTGNGRALPPTDDNSDPDFYMQFDVDDSALFAGWPTPSVKIEIEYLDEGTDLFVLQYDAASGGPYGDGRFTESRPIVKTGSGEFRKAALVLKDVYFGNRDNGADFRIFDLADGAETIRKVQVTILPDPTVINVDSCGADPLDDRPDGTAIQACINQARDGDIVTFTSGERSAAYRGYLIDRTIFLEAATARSYLTFTSTDPANPALLKATADLKGVVVKLFARSRISNPGRIDYITISHLHLDGNRAERTCLGADGIADGRDDNWGSYLPECSVADDAWCRPGTLDLVGASDWSDPAQNYQLHPDQWSSGHLVEDVRITNTECGSAFGMGGAGNVIIDNTVETAGDHVHAAGCAQTDDSEGVGDWSDGITFDGPGHLIMNNTVVDPSDVGIVFFGGRATVIRGNTIRVTSGNHGAFAGIAVHPWGLGDVSFGQVSGNTVISQGDETCGGLHTGINLGPHMWGGACLNNVVTPAIGSPGCSLDPAPPQAALCPRSGPCQLWASIESGATYLLTDNRVTGAHINYLVEGVDAVGALVDSGNVSSAPRRSDWQAARSGCNGVVWGPTDRIAHHPSLPGWIDLGIHCER